MIIQQSLVSSSKYGIKCPYTMDPQGICVHNTDNDASAKNEISYMKTNNNEVSYHIAVDNVEAIQAIPFNRNAWHAGDGGHGKGNRNYIAVEICYSLSGGPKFDKAEENAAEIIAQICNQYGWTTKNIKRHYDFSGKDCPHRTMIKGWQRFLNMVDKHLNNHSSTTNINEGSSVKGTYLVKIKASVLNVRRSPSTSSDIVTQVKHNEVYTITETNGDWGKLKSGVGWICLTYAQKVENVTIGPAKVTDGSRVVITGSKYATGESIPTWVKSNVYTVSQINGNRALLKEIMSWVYIEDLAVQ